MEIHSTQKWPVSVHCLLLCLQSLIDRSQLIKLNETANSIASATESGQWPEATDLWSKLEDDVEESTAGVNFYNIQKWGSSEQNKFKSELTSFGRHIYRKSLFHRFILCESSRTCICFCTGIRFHNVRRLHVIWFSSPRQHFSLDSC